MPPNSVNPQQALSAVQNVVKQYFEGLHHADVNKLKAIFAPDCVLKAPGIRRTRDEWLELVQSRPVPAAQGDKLNSKILSIEVMGEQAMVKVSVPLLDRHFIDYLGLLYENKKWLIVNKMYADNPIN